MARTTKRVKSEGAGGSPGRGAKPPSLGAEIRCPPPIPAPGRWNGSLAAAASLAPIEQWRLALCDSLLLDANAALVTVFTCPANQLHSARGCVCPSEVEGHFDAMFMRRFLSRIEKREGVPVHLPGTEVYAPLEAARDKRLAAEVRRDVLGPVGALGLLNAFLVDRNGAVIGWIALGTREPSRDSLRRIGAELAEVVALASRTLQAAMSLASGCLAPQAAPAPTAPLTRREKQIVELIALGLSDLNVAARLGLTEEGVGSHLKRIYAKLKVHSRVELVRIVDGS